MRKSTFNYIKDILGDYYKTDEYIKQREEELRYPHRESDLNAGIKGTRAGYHVQDNLMITIEQDKRLYALERNKRVIAEALEEADENTRVIIQELYMKKYSHYTLAGLIQQQKIFVSKTKAYELRNLFFQTIADELEIY
ncbi:transcriptional regulator [Enterococcus sp. BWB1-3]|uniref:transcriptional regulator n=1 Tax=unclassified Enterococcus TaxID=2608891 RepID=UPI00192364B8|nr:transcriptional regulator [Enterococcus sp. CWB-B31]MBL1227996.1 transcriptional regulator [Enterococcus sp. BWB1-3]MCB5954033.1 transcriptional regulator [Enterococcus sp. CWB-B31]